MPVSLDLDPVPVVVEELSLKDPGAIGPPGPQGPQGVPGADGRTIWNGAGPPSAGTGVNGDFYIDNTAHAIYGPKTAGAWGAGTNLIGPVGATGATGVAGPTGATGAAGSSVRSGSGAPAAGLGVDGDFYINTATWGIYGPKTAGAWGAPTSLVGPTGPAGAAGYPTTTGHPSEVLTVPAAPPGAAPVWSAPTGGVPAVVNNKWLSAAGGAMVWNSPAAFANNATVATANVDLPHPSPAVPVATIRVTSGGGTLRSIGAPTADGSRLEIQNFGPAVTLLHNVAGGTGLPLYTDDGVNVTLPPSCVASFTCLGTIWLLTGVTRSGPGGLTLIQEIVLGADGQIDFTGIPATYKHLRAILNVQASTTGNKSDSVCFRWNGDATTSYMNRGAISAVLADKGFLGVCNSSEATIGPQGAAGTMIVEIPNYALATGRRAVTSHYMGKVDYSGNPTNDFAVGDQDVTWTAGTPPVINRLTFFCLAAANFKAGSRAALYGL